MPVLIFSVLLIPFQAIDQPLGKEHLGNFPCVLLLRLAGVLSEEEITVAY